MALAKTRSSNFTDTSEVISGLGKRLHTLVHREQREQVFAVISTTVAELQTLRGELNAQRISLLQAVVDEHNHALNTREIERTLLQLDQQIAFLEADRSAYVAAMNAADPQEETDAQMAMFALSTNNSVEYRDLRERVGYVQRRTAAMARRGELQATEIAVFKTEVAAHVIYEDGRAIASVPLDEYPWELRAFFDSFVAKAVLHLELEIRVVNLERELSVMQRTVLELEDDLARSQVAGYATEAITRSSLVNFDDHYLRHAAFRASEVLKTYLIPIMQLWHPAAVDAVVASHGSQLAALRESELDIPSEAAWDALTQIATGLVSEYGLATLEENAGEAPVHMVAISIPRPALSPSAQQMLPPYLELDAFRAKDVWNALDSGQAATLQLAPEHLYVRSGELRLHIPCNRKLPLVRRMGLVLVHRHDLSYQNGYYTAAAGSSASQPFVTGQGLEVFLQMQEKWRSLQMPVLFAQGMDAASSERPASAVSIYEQTSESLKGDILGLSPFGSFTVHLSTGPAETLASLELPDALALVWVLELEHLASERRLDWVGSCGGTP